MPKKEIFLENLGKKFCIRSSSCRIIKNLCLQCKDYLVFNNKKTCHFFINVYYSLPKQPEADEVIVKNSKWYVGKSKESFFIFYHLIPTLVWIDKYLQNPIKVFTKDIQARIISTCIIDWIAISSLIREEKGACFHACGIADKKNGFIFMGPSGSGKSTLAKLRKTRVLIDEDDVILKKIRDKIYIFRQIGYKDEIRPLSSKITLSAIFFLQKSKNNFIKLVSKNLSFINILSNVKAFIPFWELRLDNIINFCSDLSKRIPCYILGFRKDEQFWKLIRKEMVNGVAKKNS